jgi:hypothetical protein
LMLFSNVHCDLTLWVIDATPKFHFTCTCIRSAFGL